MRNAQVSVSFQPESPIIFSASSQVLGKLPGGRRKDTATRANCQVIPKIRLLSGGGSKTLFPSNLESWRGNMLGLGSGSFDPETLVVLETAFDEAWITLKTNGSSNIRPNELARRICHLAMEGERDPVRLHDRALGELIPATIWRELS